MKKLNHPPAVMKRQVIERDGQSTQSNISTIEWRRPETVWWNTRPGLTRRIGTSDWRAEMDSTRRCSVDGCDRKHYGRGWCKTHYNYFMQNLAAEDLSSRACSICDKPHYAKGYCRKHWERNHNNGSPAPTRVLQGATLAERLAHHSVRVGDCLEWNGRCDKDGYGQIQVEGRPKRAHRVAYEIRYGPIPHGQLLRHTCDNPPCIEPAHLIPGNEYENARDMVIRGRSLTGARNSSAKLSADEVHKIRAMSAAGATQRDIAHAFGVGQSQISRILRGESWSTS